MQQGIYEFYMENITARVCSLQAFTIPIFNYSVHV